MDDDEIKFEASGYEAPAPRVEDVEDDLNFFDPNQEYASFEGIAFNLKAALKENNFLNPTKIQSAVIPKLMKFSQSPPENGENPLWLIKSETGSGKTLTYLVIDHFFLPVALFLTGLTRSPLLII